MDYEKYKSLINQLEQYLISIELTNYGEPFIHPHILDMISYAKKYNIFVTIESNGFLFKRGSTFIKDFIKSGVDHIKLALDGIDQKTLTKYRIGSNYNEFMDGLRYLLEERNRMRQKLPIVELQFIVMKHNRHQLVLITDLAKTLKIDKLTIKSLGINFLIEDDDDYSIIEQFLSLDSKISRYYKDDNGIIHLKGRIKNQCRWLHSSAVILANGDVVPCCYDATGEFVMGNAFMEPFLKIWTGAKYRKFRHIVYHKRHIIKMCRICSEGRGNLSYCEEYHK